MRRDEPKLADYSQLVHQIYHSAAHSEALPFAKVLDELCWQCGGIIAHLAETYLPNGLFSEVTAHGGERPASFLRAYQSDYKFDNPFKKIGMSFKEGELGLIAQYLPYNEFTKTPFYNEYWKKIDSYHLLTCMCTKTPLTHQSIGIHYLPGTEPSGQQIRLLQLLQPHLSQSLKLRNQLGQYKELAATATHALNSMSFGVIAIDEKGGLLFANPIADKILKSARALAYNSIEGLHGVGKNAPKFRKLLQEARAILRGDDISPAPQATKLMRPGLTPLEAIMLPVPTGFGRPGNILVFVQDSLRLSTISAELLTALRGLTQSEAQVVACLVEGMTTQAIAEELGIKISTIRTHLRRVYAKTLTHNQSELVSSLSQSLATLFLN